MMKWILLMTLFLFLAVGCDDSSETETSPLTPIFNNLNAIQGDFLPESMAVAGIQKRAEDDDICAFCAGDDLCFFQCQPAIVKRSLWMGKIWLQSGNMLINALAPHFKNIPDGTTDHFQDGDEFIQYKKVDDTTFSIRSSVSGKTLFYIDVKENQYTIKGDDSEEIPFELIINYTDQQNWTMEAVATTRTCNADMPKDPERFYITITRNDQLWSGNVIFQNPRTFAADEATCSDGDATTAFNLYTQFVANKKAAKAASYSVKQTVTDYKFSTFGLDQICKQYYDTPLWGNQSDDTFCPAAFDSYQNDFCFKPNSNEALWNNNCSDNSEISAASYLPESSWRFTPDQFHQYTITLPDTL